MNVSHVYVAKSSYLKDAFSGLEYANARWYSAGYGRFLSVDPYPNSAHVKRPGSWNRYSYAYGDAINSEDPAGLEVVGTYCDDEDICNMLLSADSGRGAWSSADADGSGSDGGLLNGALLKAIQEALHQALAKSDCAQVFGSAPWYVISPPTPTQVLDSLIVGGKYGSIRFAIPKLVPYASAVTSTNGNRLIGFTSTITINDLDAADFFNTGTSVNAGEIVLHELGHVLRNMGWSSQILPDPPGGGDTNAQNSKLVGDNCGKYLK